MADVEHYPCGADGEQRHHQPERQDVAPGGLEADDEPGEADGAQQEAAQIERRRPVLAHVLDEQRDQRDAEDADRHVDPEDPAPG
jgi:hypothetical protein